MTLVEIMSVVFGVAGALIALATLKTEQRTWLKKLSSRLALTLFTIVVVANSIFGIYSFVVKAAPPTRDEIALLLLLGYNLVQIPRSALGFWFDAEVRASKEELISAYRNATNLLENKT